MDRKIVKR